MSSSTLAVGLGSMPGLSVENALSIIAGEIPDAMHIPELPARGPGAELVGRTFGLLHRLDKSFSLETVPGGWQATHGFSSVMQESGLWLDQDIEALALIAGMATTSIKIQIGGPFTLAASVERNLAERLIVDRGARLELVAAVKEMAVFHLNQLKARLPNASFIFQVDEPALAAVLAGRIPSRTGKQGLAPVAIQEVQEGLATVVEAVGTHAEVWVHTCADLAPIQAVANCGFQAWSLPLDSLGRDDEETMSVFLERGGRWIVGLEAGQTAKDVWRRFADLGFSEEFASQHSSVSHTCGLAFDPKPELTLRRLNSVARRMREGAIERE